jgi:hypothetical protein
MIDAIEGVLVGRRRDVGGAEVMTVRNFPRLLAHLFERAGLALVGAAAGLFVGIQTGASIPAFTNSTFLLVMTIVGAVGFYLGIDTPPHRLQAIPVNLPGHRLDGRIDASELLTAVGTFLAALATFISVALIVLVLDTAPRPAAALLALWGVGALMQVAAGAIARWRD